MTPRDTGTNARSRQSPSRSLRPRAWPPGPNQAGGWPCWVALGYYVLFDKAWAYLNVPPLYIGEIILLLGIASVCYRTRWHVVLYSPYTWLILAMSAWAALQTIPYLADYHIGALSDAVLYGYSIFALIVMAHVVPKPERLVALLERLSAEEEDEIIDRINQSGAIVFIGFGCPKQDRFAYRYPSRLHAVQICSGAAFDFHAGAKAIAPLECSAAAWNGFSASAANHAALETVPRDQHYLPQKN